jgi:hypothetical protein
MTAAITDLLNGAAELHAFGAVETDLERARPPVPAAGAAGDDLDLRRQCHVSGAGHPDRSGY